MLDKNQWLALGLLSGFAYILGKDRESFEAEEFYRCKNCDYNVELEVEAVFEGGLCSNCLVKEGFQKEYGTHGKWMKNGEYAKKIKGATYEDYDAESFKAEYNLIGRRKPRKLSLKVSDLKEALENANDDADVFVGDITPVGEEMIGEPIVSAPRGVWTNGEEVYIVGATDWIHTEQIDELTWNRVNRAKDAESFNPHVVQKSRKATRFTPLSKLRTGAFRTKEEAQEYRKLLKNKGHGKFGQSLRVVKANKYDPFMETFGKNAKGEYFRDWQAESVVTDHENCGMGPSYCIECGEDACIDCDTYCDNCEQTIHKNCIEQHGDDCLEAESFGAENKTKFEATGISDYVWVLKEQNRHGTEVSIHKTKQGITQFLDEYDGNVEELDEGDWGWSGYFGNNSFHISCEKQTVMDAESFEAEKINTFSEIENEWKDSSVTIYDEDADEFYGIKEILVQEGDDVLEDGHPYLVLNKDSGDLDSQVFYRDFQTGYDAEFLE